MALGEAYIRGSIGAPYPIQDGHLWQPSKHESIKQDISYAGHLGSPSGIFKIFK